MASTPDAEPPAGAARPVRPVGEDSRSGELSDQPYWFRDGHPLAGYRSAPRLPDVADVVIVGAGLTGASAAYHVARATNRPVVRAVVLDKGDPACEASGRNGGNFELIPENSVGIYEGLARERLAFLERVYDDLPPEVLRGESERQASIVLGIALRNRELLKSIILREQIDCDFAPRGWLHLASTEEEEQGLCDEVTLAAQHGQRIELWSRHKLRREMGFDNAFLARFIPDDGTYHPFKYACGLLQRALAAGVELHTRTAVQGVVSDRPDRHRVVTDRGTIVASRVIVATNAFTARLFPELADIRPYESQIQVTEDAPERTWGRVVTSEDGPVFFSQPRGGAADGRAPLLMGGGPDRPMRDASSHGRSPTTHDLLLVLRDRYFPELRGRMPSAEWVGAMGFTPDELPAIGFLRPGVIIAAGFNGYGGSYTTAAGLAAVEMALGAGVPEWAPEDVFSPQRLMTAEPIFMTRRDSLWRIASSLCRQLTAVNRRISEALALRGAAENPARPHPYRAMPPIAEIGSAGAVDPGVVRDLPAFRAFTTADIEALLERTRRWDLDAGTRLFAEGSPGGSCFIVVRGVVHVAIEVNGQDRLLARLPAGSVFGQVSLIAGEPRSATCTIHEDAVLLELEREACERLLDTRSPLALKLLEVLNDGLVRALRGADRKLMRLDSQDGSPGGDVVSV